jgi:DNA-binding winged helix-turn-helix (wHTH) protein
MRYVFGDCELEPQRYELRRHGQVRPIEPQVFDVLALLIHERHRVVTKQELLDTVWGHRFVGESALTSRIKSLRQAVGDDGMTQGIVRTVRRRGYQFVAHVIERADPSTPPRRRPMRCRHTATAHVAPSTGCGRASRRLDRTSSIWTFRAAPTGFQQVRPP